MKMITGIKETKYVNAEELGKYIGGEVHVKASIYKIRRMKGFAFVLLRTSRLLMQDNVRYSTLFPRDVHRLTP